MNILIATVFLVFLPLGSNFEVEAGSLTRRFEEFERFERLDSLEYELLTLVISERIKDLQMPESRFRLLIKAVAGVDLTAEDIFRDKLFRGLTFSNSTDHLCKMGQLSRETFDNFVERNFKDNLVEEKFSLPMSYRVLSTSENARLEFSDSLFNAIVAGEPHITVVICRVSRVGFNKNERQALLHIQESWDSGGNSTYILLERGETSWSVTGRCTYRF